MNIYSEVLIKVTLAVENQWFNAIYFLITYIPIGAVIVHRMSLFHIIIQQSRLINALSSTQAFRNFPRALTYSWQGVGVGGDGGSNGLSSGVALLTSTHIPPTWLALSPVVLPSQLQGRLAKIVELCAQLWRTISFMNS